MPGSTGDHSSVNQSIGVLLVWLVCQSVYERASLGVVLGDLRSVNSRICSIGARLAIVLAAIETEEGRRRESESHGRACHICNFGRRRPRPTARGWRTPRTTAPTTCSSSRASRSYSKSGSPAPRASSSIRVISGRYHGKYAARRRLAAASNITFAAFSSSPRER